jgi:hypothetical protein
VTGESIRLVIIRQVIDRIEAVLIWAPDPVLLREAKGRLHLSWHLVDIADGRYILHDGPRAATGLGPAHNLAVLPLHIPTETGKYQFRIEPVVENRFWASARGYQPLALDAERIPDGSVRI